VKLLLDENLSPRLGPLIAAAFPLSVHVEHLGLRGAPDGALWDLARAESLVIVSKDDDFRQRSFLYGSPPKVIWLAIGNSRTSVIAGVLLAAQSRISDFLNDPEDGLLILRP
jgi:predicted nuclease of predicted toxin-antitoxin system